MPGLACAPSLAAHLQLTSTVERGLYALFVSAEEAWLARESSYAWLKHLGATSAAAPTRMRLRRGYSPPAAKAALDKEADLRQEEVDNAAACASPTHLLLVVHGIGQNLQVRRAPLILRPCRRGFLCRN